MRSNSIDSVILSISMTRIFSSSSSLTFLSMYVVIIVISLSLDKKLDNSSTCITEPWKESITATVNNIFILLFIINKLGPFRYMYRVEKC